MQSGPRSKVAGSGIKAFRRTSLTDKDKDARTTLPRKPQRRASYTGHSGGLVGKGNALHAENGKLYHAGPNLTDAELQRAKTAFFDVDRDGSGTIDREEVHACPARGRFTAHPHNTSLRPSCSCSRCCPRSEFSLLRSKSTR